VPTEADANAEEHADNRTEEVCSQQLSEHRLCRLYCLSEAVGFSLHGAAIVLAGTQKSSFARRRLTPGEASPSQGRRPRQAPIGFDIFSGIRGSATKGLAQRVKACGRRFRATGRPLQPTSVAIRPGEA
jgi:hypothetical protein